MTNNAGILAGAQVSAFDTVDSKLISLQCSSTDANSPHEANTALLMSSFPTQTLDILIDDVDHQ